VDRGAAVKEHARQTEAQLDASKLEVNALKAEVK
jgi:hypothetical protein